jgi:hypothetical protein
MTNDIKSENMFVGYIISLLGGFVVFYYTFGMSGFPDVYYISGIKSLSAEIYTAFSLIVLILAIISLFLILSSFAGLFLSFIGSDPIVYLDLSVSSFYSISVISSFNLIFITSIFSPDGFVNNILANEISFFSSFGLTFAFMVLVLVVFGSTRYVRNKLLD